jgi:hypothetical protein
MFCQRPGKYAKGAASRLLETSCLRARPSISAAFFITVYPRFLPSSLTRIPFNANAMGLAVFAFSSPRSPPATR